jgi:hypothetical protein
VESISDFGGRGLSYGVAAYLVSQMKKAAIRYDESKMMKIQSVSNYDQAIFGISPKY